VPHLYKENTATAQLKINVNILLAWTKTDTAKPVLADDD